MMVVDPGTVSATIRRSPPHIRVLSRAEVIAGCWQYTGSRDKYGYGRLTVWYPATKSFKTEKTHRLVYEGLIGNIPSGLTIDHLCRNRACVNPDHMEVVTNHENTLRGIGPSAINHRRTECQRGHPLSGPNLHMRPSGRRQCLTCKHAADARLYALHHPLGA